MIGDYPSLFGRRTTTFEHLCSELSKRFRIYKSLGRRQVCCCCRRIALTVHIHFKTPLIFVQRPPPSIIPAGMANPAQPSNPTVDQGGPKQVVPSERCGIIASSVPQ